MVNYASFFHIKAVLVNKKIFNDDNLFQVEFYITYYWVFAWSSFVNIVPRQDIIGHQYLECLTNIVLNEDLGTKKEKQNSMIPMLQL